MSEVKEKGPMSSKAINNLIEELANLKRKAALMQFCHGKLAITRSNREDIVLIAIALLAGAASFLTTADAQKLAWIPLMKSEVVPRVATLLSATVFILAVIHRQSQWAVKSGKHAVALEQYTKFLRRLDIYLKSGIEDKPISEVEKEAIRFAEDYSRIGETAPKIPYGKRFLKLKQEHLQTVTLSRELDEAPFADINSLRKKLSSGKKE